MWKRYTALLSICIGTSTLLPLLAQDRHCGSSEYREQLLARDPHLAQREAEAEALYQQAQQHRDGEDTTVYVIPMVFHVLHQLGAENITDAQIRDAVAVLNRDYRKLNEDAANACCGFGAIAADVRLEFRLAQIDPYGNCTNGIDRIMTLRTFNATDSSKLHPWFRERYLNIWVVRTMGDPGVAGYAYLPPDVEGPHSIADGIVVLSDYVGRIGTSSPSTSRTLTHEVGHWLNLKHVWGPGNTPGLNCGDDLVDDTPVTKGFDHCPSPEQSKVCDPDIYENFQNYMDYSYCNVMFTNGQRDRMRTALTSTIADRSNLWTAANLIATGTEDGHVSQCAPRADFYSYVLGMDGQPTQPLGCAGTAVQFHDNSGVADATGWQWSFPGGTPSSSTEQHPVVTYAEGGSYGATLTVTNAYGSSSITKMDVALIAPGYAEVDGLLQEPFDDQAAADRWPVRNIEHNQTTWAWTAITGHNADGCYRINASQTVDFSDPIGSWPTDVDELLTPTMDLSHVTSGELTFWYAAATQASNTGDVQEQLKVYTSSDCGTNWSLRKTIDAPEIVTAGTAGAGYMPIAGDWHQATVPITAPMRTSDLRFKFVYTSSLYSNDLFLDDINIDATVGISEVGGETVVLELQPNPAKDHVTVRVNAPANSTLTLLDATGRVAWAQAVRTGEQRIELDLAQAGLGAGVYLVRLDHPNGRRVQRLVVR